MEQLKDRNEMGPKYQWDLTTLFQSNEEWENAFNALDAGIEKTASYQGKLNNAKTIHEFLLFQQEFGRLLSNVFEYANLKHSEDAKDSTASSMYARTYSKYVLASSAGAYAVPEILSLSDEKLNQIIQDPIMEDFKFYMNDLMREKAHVLSAKEEQLLARLGEALATPSEAASNLQDADLVFEPVQDSQGKTYEVSNATYIPLQFSADRVLRENSFRSYYKAYKQHITTFSSTYNGCVKSAVAQSQARNYSSSRQMSMSSDNIPVSVYDSLIEAVHNNMDLMYRYIKLRKRLLKIDDLHYYDVYAPLTSDSTKKYTYEEAQQMVLEAVKPLGDEYVARVQKAYDEKWIDVYPNIGKAGGAFSAGTYDSNPFILLNYTEDLDSVSTLAHEMGHSQHTWLTNHTQPVQYSDYSLFVAEVASTVNENLLIEQLLAKENDPANRLALLNRYLEGFKGTVYRQTMFAEFEKLAHQRAEEGQSLDSTSLNELYKELIQLYFGEDLIIDEEVQYEWARIPHFYRPFYVYVYATGYSTAAALSQGILTEGQPAVKRYLEFLSMGSSAYPLDELKHAGVDLTTPEPIEKALKKFEQVLIDAEKTADQLGL